MTKPKRQLDLTEGEERGYSDMHGLSTNEQGEKILAGLTVEESIFVVEHRRRDLAYRLDDLAPRPPKADRLRHQQLADKHERARVQVLAAEHELRANKPTVN
ncbi:hypothetical protein ACFSOZ_38605 [Mesorhizobium newzealandense]|uniref:Uncharacterized protein n=1 Tax=Mesorhizobium newzealandense TaxID=1300302 RepID=A0ABW4UPL5_9HYPH